MKALRLAVFCLLTVFTLKAQQPDFARSVIQTLCSESYAGRGYVKDGAEKAATFIADDFKKSGLSSFGPDYFQPIGYPVIAFPYEVNLKADGTEMIPGDEFIVDPGCPSINGVFDVIYVDSAVLDNPQLFREFEKHRFVNAVFMVNIAKNKQIKFPERLDAIFQNTYKVRALIHINQPKLTWSVALEFDSYPQFYVLKGTLPNIPSKVTITVKPEVRNYNGNNVVGYIKGNVNPDSFVVFSAHYDHLGMMGTWAIFPGANDNASGVAMLLDLMHYYKQHPPAYSVCFMAFTGEEAGLLGSYYYTEHPLFPLQQISVLINLDLMGTGDKGMTVVNATFFPQDFQNLQMINFDKNYLANVSSRGKAQNSDHYYFSEKGVKAFFFYLMGEYNAYHDVNDNAEAITFSKYPEAFMLIRDFADTYAMRKK